MRRAVDVVVSCVGLVLLSPLLVFVGTLVRLTMGRPVLFRQRRSGMGSAEFTIVKFRTMRAERVPGEPDAERVTALGRMLRATSFDEVPQLWNVLMGDMSLVGPRPTLPEQVVHYDERQRGRLTVRPGLTGWAQVNGRNSLSWPERIELDLWYIAHRSTWLDLRIVALTLVALVRRQGVTAAGGVNPGFPVPGPGGQRDQLPPRPGAGP